MDDILIPAKTKGELRERTLIVLKKLKENNLFLKPEKCEFEQTKVEYLGFIISEGKVQMDPKEGCRHCRLACTDHTLTTQILLRIWKLLLTIYMTLFRCNETT
jgi:hypothetical protein